MVYNLATIVIIKSEIYAKDDIMTAITKKHWIELIIRCVILLSTIASCIVQRITNVIIFQQVVYCIIFVFFTYKMISRLIPSKNKSMGNQKIFKQNCNSAKRINENVLKMSSKEGNRVAAIVAIVWLLANCSVFILYFCKVFDRDIMMIIAMAFSVCDLVCVLGICPFQKIFMRNKCCNTCRIYNWDFAMMFTPLWVMPSVMNYTLVLQSIIVLIHWELHHKKYPDRFYEEFNELLKCKNCKELMCKNKLRKVKTEVSD